MNASELVQQMHDTLSAIHDTISGISTESHEALLTELEQKRESLLAELRDTFDKEQEEVTLKRQAETDEIAEKRRIEDEEIAAKRRLEDEELQSKNDAEDLERHEKLDGDIKLVDDDTDKQMDEVEAAAQKIIDEARDKLKELEEKRKEINRLIDEHLESPPFPPVPTRKRARAGDTADSTDDSSEEKPADAAEPAEAAPVESAAAAESTEETPAEAPAAAAETAENAAPAEEAPAESAEISKAEPAEEAATEPADEAAAEPAEEASANAAEENEEKALVVVNGGDETTSEPAPEDQEDQSNNNDKAPEAEMPSGEGEEPATTEDEKEADLGDVAADPEAGDATATAEDDHQQSESDVVDDEEPEHSKGASESDPVTEQQDGEVESAEEAQTAGIQVADSGIGLDPEVEAGKSRPASPSGSESPDRAADEEGGADSAEDVEDEVVDDAKPLESEATDVNEDLNTSQSEPMSPSDEQPDLSTKTPDLAAGDDATQAPAENDEQSSKDAAPGGEQVPESNEDDVECDAQAAESPESAASSPEVDEVQEEVTPVVNDDSPDSSREVVSEHNDDEQLGKDEIQKEADPVPNEEACAPEHDSSGEAHLDDSNHPEKTEAVDEAVPTSNPQEDVEYEDPKLAAEEPDTLPSSRPASPASQPEAMVEQPESPSASRAFTPVQDEKTVEPSSTRSSTPDTARSSDAIASDHLQGEVGTDESELPEESGSGHPQETAQSAENETCGLSEKEAESTAAADTCDDTEMDNEADTVLSDVDEEAAVEDHLSQEMEPSAPEATVGKDHDASLVHAEDASEYSSVEGEAGSHILSSDAEHGESESVTEKEEASTQPLAEEAATNEQEDPNRESAERVQDDVEADQSLQESMIDDQVVQSSQRSQLLGESEECPPHDEEREYAQEDQERGLERQEEENPYPAEDHSSVAPEEQERYLEFSFPDDDYSYNISVSEDDSRVGQQHVTHDYTYDNTVLHHTIDDSAEYSMSQETDEDSQNLSINAPTRQKTISPLPVENVTVQGQDDLFDDTETASSHFSDEEDSEIIDSALPEQRTFSGDRIHKASVGQYDGASWGEDDFTEDYESSVEPQGHAPIIQEPTPTPTQSKFNFASSFGIRMVDDAEAHNNPQLGTPARTPTLEPVPQRNIPDISPLALQGAGSTTPNRGGLSSSRHAAWNDPRTPTKRDFGLADPKAESEAAPEIDPAMFIPRDVTNVPWHARNDSEPFSMRSQSTLSSVPSSPVHSSLPIDKNEPVIRDSWHNPPDSGARSRAGTQFTDRNAGDDFDPFKYDSPKQSPYDINSPRRSIQVDRPTLESNRNSMTGSPMFQKLRSMFEAPGGGGGDSSSRNSSPTRSRPVSSIFQTMGRERSSSQLRESHIPSRPSSPRKSFMNEREEELDERSALLQNSASGSGQ